MSALDLRNGPTYSPGYLVTGGGFFEPGVSETAEALSNERIQGNLINIAYGDQQNFFGNSVDILRQFSGLTAIIGIDPSGENAASEDQRITSHRAYAVEFLRAHPEIRGNFVIASYDDHIEPNTTYQRALAELMIDRCNDWIRIDMCHTLAKIFLESGQLECVLNELTPSGSGGATFVKKKSSPATPLGSVRTEVSEILG